MRRPARAMMVLTLAAPPAAAQPATRPQPAAPPPQPVRADRSAESQARAPAGPAKPTPQKRRSVADDTLVRLRGSAWATALDGHVSVGQTFPATIGDIDLIDDLNIDPDRAVLSGSIGVNLGRDIHVTAGYAGPFRFEGTSDPIDISFSGLVFSGIIASKADVDIYQVDLAFDVLEAGPITVSFGPGLRILDFEASVTGDATDPIGGTTAFLTRSASGVAPLPGPGLGLRLDFTERIYAQAAVRGIYLGDYGNFFDASGEVGIDFTRNIGVFAGYRWMHAEADVSDVDFEVNLDGLFAGVEVRF